MPVFCLSTQADYACRHSGACCTSGWPIHVESGRLARLQGELAAGRLRLPRSSGNPPGDAFTDAVDLPPGTGAVLGVSGGACAFYDAGPRRCAIHRELGHEALPAACQHFPRRCLIEPGRTAVSLSHYCPTVARMAFRTGRRPAIVEAPDGLVGRLHLEGLDARDALPPLVRPGLLADLDGYHEWERVVIGQLARERESPERMLRRIVRATTKIAAWRPSDGPLRCAVERSASEEADAGDVPNGPEAEPTNTAADYATAAAAVSSPFAAEPAPPRLDELDARWVAPAWPSFSRPLANFLSAHAFGSWLAYHGTGLATVVRSLEVALSVVRVEAARFCGARGRALDEDALAEAFRRADLLLVHLADPQALAARLTPQPAGRERPRR